MGKKKNKLPIQIISILDMSGSMSSLQDEVIGAYNFYIKDQKEQSDGLNVEVTLVLFDDRYEVPFDKIPLDSTPELTKEIYSPRGMTALYDAIGKTIDNFSEYKDVVMVIQTDGAENASKIYDQPTLKRLIEQKEKDGWDITFLGANIDAKQVGSSFGLSLDKSIQFDYSTNGIQEAFATMADTTISYRASKV